MKNSVSFVLVILAVMLQINMEAQNLKLHPKGYFSARGIEVTVFDDIYPDGHQTGVTMIQHGERVMANGDLRLEISPGQWSPVPKEVEKKIDPARQTISQSLSYPDETKNHMSVMEISAFLRILLMDLFSHKLMDKTSEHRFVKERKLQLLPKAICQE